MIKFKHILALLLLLLLLPVCYFDIQRELKRFEQVEDTLLLIELTTKMPLTIFGLAIGSFSLIKFANQEGTVFLLPVILSAVNGIALATIRMNWEIRESSPVQLEAHYSGSFNGITLSLRRNGTYQLNDFGMFGGTLYFGTYYWKKDTLNLSKQHSLEDSEEVMCSRLIFRNDSLIVLTDSNGLGNENNLFAFKAVKPFGWK